MTGATVSDWYEPVTDEHRQQDEYKHELTKAQDPRYGGGPMSMQHQQYPQHGAQQEKMQLFLPPSAAPYPAMQQPAMLSMDVSKMFPAQPQAMQPTVAELNWQHEQIFSCHLFPLDFYNCVFWPFLRIRSSKTPYTNFQK
jgi:hypothetical protein